MENTMVLDGVGYSAYTVLRGHIITYGNALPVIVFYLTILQSSSDPFMV